MNPDTGIAETPAHPKAFSWRRDLDWKIERYERRMDRERELDERVAVMTDAEKNQVLREYAATRAANSVFSSAIAGSIPGDSFEAKPGGPGSLMGRLVSGQPISRDELRRHQW